MKLLTILLVLGFATTTAFAADPGPLRDFCIGINSTKDAVFITGSSARIQSSPLLTISPSWGCGHLETRQTRSDRKSPPGFIDQFLGINTLWVSKSRIDFAPYGLNPPHAHPRDSEILLIVKGTLYAGFVTSNQLGNRLFAKVLYPGDLIAIPMGLIHFHLNIGKTNAMAFTSFSSQNPGVMSIVNSVFGAQPLLSITEGFQVDKDVVEYLQSQTWGDNYT